jgi:hypothetical protein
MVIFFRYNWLVWMLYLETIHSDLDNILCGYSAIVYAGQCMVESKKLVNRDNPLSHNNRAHSAFTCSQPAWKTKDTASESKTQYKINGWFGYSKWQKTGQI